MRDKATSITLCIIGILLILFAISSRKPIPLNSLEKIEKQTNTNTNQNTGLRLFVDAKIIALTKENLRLNNEIIELNTKLDQVITITDQRINSFSPIQAEIKLLQLNIKQLNEDYSTSKTYVLEEYNNTTNRLSKIEQSIEEFYKDKKYFFSERDRLLKSIKDLQVQINELKKPVVEEKSVISERIILVPCQPCRPCKPRGCN